MYLEWLGKIAYTNGASSAIPPAGGNITPRTAVIVSELQKPINSPRTLHLLEYLSYSSRSASHGMEVCLGRQVGSPLIYDSARLDNVLLRGHTASLPSLSIYIVIELNRSKVRQDKTVTIWQDHIATVTVGNLYYCYCYFCFYDDQNGNKYSNF